MDLEKRINENYERLTANDREVLNLILRDKDRTTQMNSPELAAHCHPIRLSQDGG